jgi:hypothetical protein
VVRVRGGLVPPSRLVRFARPGVYFWAAFYSADARSAPLASRCPTEVLKVRKTWHHREARL